MKQELHKGQKGEDCLIEVGLGELWTGEEVVGCPE